MKQANPDPPSREWIVTQEPLIRSSSNFKHKLMGPNQNKKGFIEDDLQWKMTYNGR